MDKQKRSPDLADDCTHLIRTEAIEHLIYAPVPLRGYSIRAKSGGAVEEEFNEATKDWFVPFDENLYSDYAYESRVINAPFGSQRVYLSRIFRRPKLDDLGRDGQVCHIASIPKEMISSGLLLRDVDSALASFEEKNGIPVGKMESVTLSWDSQQDSKVVEDKDLQIMRSVVPEESARKLVSYLTESSDSKVYIVYKRGFFERIQLVYAISKFLFSIDFPSYTVTSDCPMEIILNYFANVVVSDFLPHLKPNSNWKIINLTPTTGSQSQSLQEKKKKIDDTFRNLYSPS